MGNITNQERERRRQAQEALMGLAILMILLPFVIKIIAGLIKLLWQVIIWICIAIAAIVAFPFKKPKIALPIPIQIAPIPIFQPC